MLHVKITAQLTQLIAAFFPQRPRFEYASESCLSVFNTKWTQNYSQYQSKTWALMTSHISRVMELVLGQGGSEKFLALTNVN